MEFNDLVKILRAKPYIERMGSGLLAKRFHTTRAQIIKAKKVAYKSQTTSNKIPRILLFDVETAPMRAYVWSRWKQDIHLNQTISEWFMIAWSAKWLYADEIIGDVLTSDEAIQEDDSRIVKHLWELINEADIVIAYNGRRADIPWMNSRFIVHNLLPPKPYFLIDPIETAKKQFGFSSNKLDALAGYFGIEHKLNTDFNLWKDCMEGNEEALYYMLEYNKKDVLILEEVYLRLRPWIKSHPNIGNYVSSTVPVCSICGSEQLELIHGQYYFTNVGKYALYRCKDCGAITRGRLNLNKGINDVMPILR